MLLSRDLASHDQLLSNPVIATDADTAVAFTKQLFQLWGAPLVVKSDNGSAFKSERFQQLLGRWGVVQLLSPPATPRYNGGVEPGAGCLKARICYEAMRHGRPTQWTSDDVEAARQWGNHLLRPWGAGGATPAEAWAARTPISRQQRRQFVDRVRLCYIQIKIEQGLQAERLEGPARATVARAAIRRALERLGYLSVRRRRISPPLNSPLRYIIT